MKKQIIGKVCLLTTILSIFLFVCIFYVFNNILDQQISIYTMAAKAWPFLIIIYLAAMIIAFLLANRMIKNTHPPVESSRQVEERQKSEKMRREFSANVSHELKTPLTSISGYAELMKNEMVKPEDVPVFAEKIHKEAVRLMRLINDTIKISGLDERKVGIEKEQIDLMQAALEIKERLEVLAEHHKVTIEVSGQPIKILAVRQMIDELIYNLCENAMKYNKAGGKVRITIGETSGKARIEIADNGIGIPKKYHDRVFERFYSVDKSHSRQNGGSGLGLAIVKHVVEYHDGEIILASEEGKGTKIVVLL